MFMYAVIKKDERNHEGWGKGVEVTLATGEQLDSDYYRTM